MKKLLKSSVAFISLSAITFPALALTPDEVLSFVKEDIQDAGFTLKDENISRKNGSILIKDTIMNKDGFTLFIPSVILKPVGSSVDILFPGKINGRGNSGESVVLDLSASKLRLNDSVLPSMLGNIFGNFEGDVSVKISNKELEIPEYTDFFIKGINLSVSEGVSSGFGKAELTTSDTFFAFSGNVDGEDLVIKAQYGPSVSVFGVSDVSLFSSDDPVKLISNGVDLFLSSSQDFGKYTVLMNSSDQMVKTSWGITKTDIRLDRMGLSYNVEANSFIFDFNRLSNMPLDLSGTLGKLFINFKLPLFNQNKEESVDLSFGLLNTSISSENYQNIPLELKPFLDQEVNINASATATVTMKEDFWPQSIDSMGNYKPYVNMIKDVTINKLSLQLGQSKLNATGVMNMNGESMFNIQPGKAKAFVKLTGIDNLFDILVRSGITSSDETSMASIMLRGVAKPGESSTLSYDIEMDGPGSIKINGNKF